MTVQGQTDTPENSETDGPETDGLATNGPATNGPATNGPATNGPETNTTATPLGGRFVLGRLLARGPTTEIYLAFDTTLGDDAVVKIVPESLLEDASALEHVRAEARALAVLHHENIVSMLDSGESGGRPYIAMEYVAGGSLNEVLGRDWSHRGSPMAIEDATRIAGEIGTALDHARRAAVVHPALQPRDVLLTLDLHTKITGFSSDLPSIGEQEATFVRSAEIGSRYLAPELVLGRPSTMRSDLYTVGALLYHMVTGRPPFEGDSLLSVAFRHVDDEVIPPSRINDSIPPGLESVILRLLAKNPGRRYGSAGELCSDLEHLRLGVGISPATAGFPQDVPAVAPAVHEDPPAPSSAARDYPAITVNVPRPTAIAPQPVYTSSSAPRRRSRTPIVLGSIVLLAGIGVGAWRVLNGSSHEVLLPNLTGASKAVAQTRARGLGLRVITRLTPAAPAMEGAVISQSPMPSRTVQPGATVTLFIGATRMVRVPAVKGLSSAAAQATLRRAGFATSLVGVTPASPAVRDGLVVAEQPVAGRAIAQGSRVVLDISKTPKVKVPNVGGLTLPEAAVVLQQSGLVVGAKFPQRASPTVAAGLVVGAMPSSPTAVPKGSTVELVVSAGPPVPTTLTAQLVTVPSVVGEAVKRAARAIKERGLSYRVEQRATNVASLDGTVAKTSPRVGTEVAPGSVVVLTMWTYSPPTT